MFFVEGGLSIGELLIVAFDRKERQILKSLLRQKNLYPYLAGCCSSVALRTGPDGDGLRLERQLSPGLPADESSGRFFRRAADPQGKRNGPVYYTSEGWEILPNVTCQTIDEFLMAFPE